MVSPARNAFLRKAAAAAAAAASSVDPIAADASPYEVLRAALGNALAEVKAIQSIEAKIERKRELLPNFTPWCDGVLTGAAEAEAVGDYRAPDDDIVTQVLIWSLDVGDFDRALELAAYTLRFGLALPERFKRTAATMVAEEIAEAGLKAAGQGEAFPLEVLQQADELTAKEDMPDEARAKLKKAIGLELTRQAHALPDEGADGAAAGKRAAIEAALESLKRALALNQRAGVKKEIERLEREAKRLASEA
jgi:hypothetical protein